MIEPKAAPCEWRRLYFPDAVRDFGNWVKRVIFVERFYFRMSQMIALKLLRVKQWVKNAFVFLPMLFGGRLLSGSEVCASLVAFICFCLASSSIYILNDIVDCKTDRRHPVKRLRPIASGRVSVTVAAPLSALLSGVGLTLSRWMLPVSPGVTWTIAAYIALNLLYSYWLKHFAIIDVMVIAAGFVLRVLCGGFACAVQVSPWLSVMVFMLTLFIAFAKRRDDLLKINAGKNVTRRSVAGYTIGFIDQTMSLLAAAMIVAYIIYTLQPDVMERFGSQYVYLTTLFVIAGILRYLQTAIVRNDSGRPTEQIYTDPFLISCVVCWIVSFIIIIYC